MESAARRIVSESAYPTVIWVSVSLLALIFGLRNPAGDSFGSIIAPALLLFSALQWLLLLPKLGWQLSGSLVAIVGALLVLFSRALFSHGHVGPYISGICVGITIQFAIVCLSVLDKKTTAIAIAQSLAVAFAIAIGAYLSTSGRPSPRFHTERLVFLVPLAAAAIWINSTISGWRRSTRIIFILLMLQLCIGFIDLGAAQHQTWIWVSAAFFFLIGFAFLVAWARHLNEQADTSKK